MAPGIKASVLIVEDEDAIVTLLQYNLEKEGYRVRTTDNGNEAFMLIREDKPDIIILDWMLPGMSGVEICSKIREDKKNRDIPIIMLTAKGEELDRITGLETGADDYMTKPFSPAELSARIKAVLRRMRPAFSSTTMEFEQIKMDLDARRVTFGDEEVHLGPKEFQILQCLMEHPGRVLTRDQLMSKIWGYDIYVEPRTIDVHINRLRNALNNAGGNGNVVKTIRSAGYTLRSAKEASED